ncbi:hypothetical protein [Nocardia neocaledoniensis]|uniref:hypothetical protein n=1 Tax=Nocardia neocaledoniensis TaxID=236511 RepID=UPI0024543B5C|nr:hypothetical protein [Nocardia neocaledoniensis]
MTRPELPTAPARLALPWGDSAYTSVVYNRHPDHWWPVTSWCMGPLTNGLTPSSEGPRRRDEVEARAITRMIEQARSKRWDRLLSSWGDTTPTWEAIVGEAPYAKTMPDLSRGNRVGWIDQHGELHTGVVTDRRDTRRGTELDITPDEEGSTP